MQLMCKKVKDDNNEWDGWNGKLKSHKHHDRRCIRRDVDGWNESENSVLKFLYVMLTNVMNYETMKWNVMSHLGGEETKHA